MERWGKPQDEERKSMSEGGIWDDEERNEKGEGDEGFKENEEASNH